MNIKKTLRKKTLKLLNNFLPYIKKMEVEGIEAKFFYGTEQAKEWYDPLKPYAKLEYEWVLKNIKLENQNIIDGGSHHGQYSVVFGLGAKGNCNLVSVDPVPMNCDLTTINMKLNDLPVNIEQCAISNQAGEVSFSNQSNGFISKRGSLTVKTKKLTDILPDANVVKLDIEGHEFNIFPQVIEEMTAVHSWIIEVHPHVGKDPNIIAGILAESGFEILWVNRDKNIVEKYQMGTKWNIHSTIFALKK